MQSTKNWNKLTFLFAGDVGYFAREKIRIPLNNNDRT